MRTHTRPGRPPAAARRVAAVHRESGRVVADALAVADTFPRRLWGLLGRRRLAPGEGMVFPACRAVHTWGMRTAIDVIFLDRAGRVVRVVPGLRPWRAAWARGAWWCLELAPGAALPGKGAALPGKGAAAGLVPGDVLELRPALPEKNPAPPPGRSR